MTFSILKSMIILTGVLSPACIFAVALRFGVRKHTNTRYGWDDFFALLALLSYLTYQAFALYGAAQQGSKAIAEVSFPKLEAELRASYIAELFSPMIFTFAKLSILFLYNRIFQSDKTFRIWMAILFTVNITWGFGTLMSSALQCTPVAKTWNVLLPGHCINFSLFSVLAEIPNSLMDFVMMVLPINILRKLQMSWKTKISVGFIFCLGATVGIIGFVRIASIYNPQAINLDEDGILIIIQQAAAVICCCLPTYGPLLKRFDLFGHVRIQYQSLLRRITGFSSSSNIRKDDNTDHFATKETIGGRKYNRFDKTGNVAKDEGWVLTRSEAVIKRDGSFEAGNYPLEAIAVQRTVDVV